MERAIVQASSWVAVIDGLSNNFLGDPVYLKLIKDDCYSQHLWKASRL